MNSIKVLKGYNGNDTERVTIEDTRFIFKTNLQGDPKRDERFGSRECKANVIIPEDFARELADAGCNPRHTNEDEDGNVEWFIPVKINFDSWKAPKIYLVVGDTEPRTIDEDLIGEIDNLADSHSIANVKLVANTYKSDRSDFKTLYVDTMYVEQSIDDDPFYNHYRHHDRSEEVPFE